MQQAYVFVWLYNQKDPKVSQNTVKHKMWQKRMPYSSTRITHKQSPWFSTKLMLTLCCWASMDSKSLVCGGII